MCTDVKVLRAELQSLIRAQPETIHEIGAHYGAKTPEDIAELLEMPLEEVCQLMSTRKPLSREAKPETPAA